MSLELTQTLADDITRTNLEQISTCRTFKRPRLEKIKQFEDLYMGIVPKSLRNPYNYDYGFLSSFVDNLTTKIDRRPQIKFGYQDLADAKAALRIQAAYDLETNSALPNTNWDLKDRWGQRLAVFSGRSTYRIYADSEPEYKSHFDIVDHYDFLFEPNGGGLLDNHMFLGDEAVFLTEEQLTKGAQTGYYDRYQVGKILNGSGANEYKEVSDELNIRNNRSQALGLDGETNNYVGNAVFKFVQLVSTLKGKRWYNLIEERSRIWIRLVPLSQIIPSELYPYVSWATHEDPKSYLSKGPCDTAYPIAESINTFLNQELYNREKKIMGRELYDPTMVHDFEAFVNPRPDGKIPIDTKGGNRKLSEAIFRSPDGDISGTLDLVSFLDSYGGRNSGSTPGSQGASENNKKVGIYFAENQEIKSRLGINNESKRDAYKAIGLRYVQNLDEHLTGEMPIKIMGTKGVEWTRLTRADLKRNRDLDIIITGGVEEDQLNQLKNEKKAVALSKVTTVNPKWKDREILKAGGYTDEQVQEAYSSDDSASLELMSEAARAVEDIVEGLPVKLNKGANTAFMLKIIDIAKEIGDDIPDETFNKIIEYSKAHAQIAAANEARNASEMIYKNSMNAITPNPFTAPRYPTNQPPPSASPIPNGTGMPTIP